SPETTSGTTTEKTPGFSVLRRFMPFQPKVVGYAAVTTESKQAYSDTIWQDVTRFRIVTPDKIEINRGTGWSRYLDPPQNETPISIAACRTMEKAAYSLTTWVKVHIFLLTKSGTIWESIDGSPWEVFIKGDGEEAIGIASASYAEKAAYSSTTYWNIRLFRLLKDGSIESSEGHSWEWFASPGSKRVLAISAASWREKAFYSDTTWWHVGVFRLLDDGTVEKSETGADWSRYTTLPNATVIAAYTVEEKAAYSPITWVNIEVEGASEDPQSSASFRRNGSLGGR
ncbi:MAG: hypothetical protein NZT92_13635, partial [Abditibacteriales bacterium]|nr:hypothetical protein [Abditibacteriales bacterium]MDW8366970.1 hypothetical protein [Abditibacteriales bacterium]